MKYQRQLTTVPPRPMGPNKRTFPNYTMMREFGVIQGMEIGGRWVVRDENLKYVTHSPFVNDLEKVYPGIVKLLPLE